MKKFKYVIAILFAALAISCVEKTPENVNFTEANTNEIAKFIADNNFETQNTASGLHYIIEEGGQGNNPLPSSTVRVAYKGYFTNGTIFDESSAEGIVFPLNRVIRGWTEGIPLFEEGGKGKLIIPSRLAYGTTGTRGIPPGAVLVFDIHLIEIEE